MKKISEFCNLYEIPIFESIKYVYKTVYIDSKKIEKNHPLLTLDIILKDILNIIYAYVKKSLIETCFMIKPLRYDKHIIYAVEVNNNIKLEMNHIKITYEQNSDDTFINNYKIF